MIVETKKQSPNSFCAAELYLLGEAFEANYIFGLPDKGLQSLINPHAYEEAMEELKVKAVFDEENHLTKGGYFLIRALKEFVCSKKYMRINNAIIGFSEIEPDNLIVLTEIEPEIAYTLSVMDKLVVMKELFDSIPLINREPLEDEKEFLQQKLRNRERRLAEELDVGENFLSFQVLTVSEMTTEEELAENWLLYEDSNKLYGIATSQQKYYRLSQYWLMKELFDGLELPIKQVDQKE